MKNLYLKNLLVVFFLLGFTGLYALPITATFNKSIPEGWTYITNNEAYPNPDYYTDGGLKLNFEGMGIESPSFDAESTVTVRINIQALNANTKTSAASEDIFTITGLNSENEVVATGTLGTVNAGTNNTVTLNGNDIVKVSVIMTGYPEIDGVYQNVNMAGVTITGENGGGTSLNNNTIDSPVFYVSGNNLMTKNLEDGTMVEVYNALGAKVQTSFVISDNVRLNPSLTKGLYIIKAGNYTQKIMF